MERENTPHRLRNIAEETPNLPEEIIEQILSRLPVKSLLKFRCVSKSWLSLIGSKQFAKIHLENSAKNTAFGQHVIIIRYTSSGDRLEQCSLDNLLSEPTPCLSAFDDPFNIPVKSIFLVGCCNGLVCIHTESEYFYLWNPSTRMSKKLPDIGDEMRDGLITRYGFGFDEWNDDYKVFVECVFAPTERRQNIDKIYSLKSNSWKIIKEREDYSLDEAGTFASGKLHWSRGYGDGTHIVSFDLKSEVYGMVELPCYSEGLFCPSLGVLGGCLSLICDYLTTHLDLWVMKQYGVKQSWHKLMTVPHLHDPQESPSITPFAIGPNGEIVSTYESTFVIYPKDNVFQRPWTIKIDLFHEAGLYIESLVSLAPDGEQERGNPQNQ